MDSKVRDIFNKLNQDDWENLRDSSIEIAEMKSCYLMDWYNLKYFRKEQDNPEELQLNDPTKLFGVKNARFSLLKQPVAYFSVAPYIGMMETKCRDVEDATGILAAWFDGIWCPDPNSYGYNLQGSIVGGAAILDLSFSDNPLRTRIDAAGRDLLDEMTTSRDVSVYPQTQRFSEILVENGFDGLIWNSVRYKRRQINEPRQVMVMYDDNAIKIM